MEAAADGAAWAGGDGFRDRFSMVRNDAQRKTPGRKAGGPGSYDVSARYFFARPRMYATSEEMSATLSLSLYAGILALPSLMTFCRSVSDCF
ncbi:MAG: hypothetical protein QOE68_2331 [Thermoanaerobaculia bacterium]|nr:hypothetical protein [Thermoanaerobaculia bacterium]